MTQTNEKTKALKHVREACPELMEWGDGMFVQFEWFSSSTNEGGSEEFTNEPNEFELGIIAGEYVVPTNFSSHVVGDLELSKDSFGGGTVYSENEGDVWEYVKAEIIGHTTHLEHWLRATESIRTPERYCSPSINCQSESVWFKLIDDDNPELIIAEYDTTKDGDNQSPEFYQAYNEITS